MNELVKAKWLKALRSGEYIQGQRRLCRINSDGNKTYCCLGVLTDLYLKEHNKQWNETPHPMEIAFSYQTSSAYLHIDVILWAGLNSTNPAINKQLLTTMNDSYNMSFEEIAKHIEEYL